MFENIVPPDDSTTYDDHPMPVFLQSLFVLMVRCTRQVQYLKVENQILRSKLPKRIKITPKRTEFAP